jgi:hypothetical protein
LQSTYTSKKQQHDLKKNKKNNPGVAGLKNLKLPLFYQNKPGIRKVR